MQPKLYLIDGSGFIFRAFHALPPMTRADGTPVNAVMGFVNMLLKLLMDFHAGQLAVIFDASRANFRNDLYADYKANRSDTPEELIPQMPLIREAVAAFNLPSIELEGYEADDLIAAYSCLARDRGQEVTIVSSDKDLMQLIREGVDMFDPIKNRTIGPAEVMEKFGVTPDKMIEVQSLIGDSVDNVPGVPGIGPKTAAELINEFGTLENLLDNAHTIKQPKRRESLVQFADQARLSKRLVTLDCATPVPVALEDLVVRAFDRDQLIAFCRAQGLRAVANRLEGRGFDMAVPEPTTIAVLPPSEAGAPVTVDYRPDLQGWIARAIEAGRLAFTLITDHDCACMAGLTGMALSVAPGQACYVPFGHLAADAPEAGTLSLEPVAAPEQIDLRQAVEALKPLFENPAVLKIGHNLKSSAQVLETIGLKVTPFDDTMLLSYVLDGTTHGHTLVELAELFFTHTMMPQAEVTGSGKARLPLQRAPLDKVTPYAAEEADIVLRLHALLRSRLVPERMTTLYETMERPLIPVVARMERQGIKVDLAVLRQLSARFASELAVLETDIQQLAGREFNIGSPRQLGEILFGELRIEGGRKTKTGDWSTDSSILEPLAEAGNTIVAKVLDWRQTAKLKNTYTDSLQNEIQPSTGRVHTSYALAATNTGRLSSTAPNLQNIPIRTDAGKEIRRAFIAEDGHKLLSVDYSQIELRLAAEIAGIAALVEAFRNGDDIHALTASQVFGVKMAERTPDLRRAAKAINFGIIYGISGFGLAQQLGIDSRQASEYIRQYLGRFGELAEYMEETKAFCRRTGYVVTLFGRKCHMPGINEKNPARRASAERQAINARLQGTAADIMRRAMIKVSDAIDREKLPARLLLQVHDELMLEVPDGAEAEVAARVRAVMESTVSLGVPLQADAGWGVNWGEAH
jgi:DNA polymerase-1